MLVSNLKRTLPGTHRSIAAVGRNRVDGRRSSAANTVRRRIAINGTTARTDAANVRIINHRRISDPIWKPVVSSQPFSVFFSHLQQKNLHRSINVSINLQFFLTDELLKAKQQLTIDFYNYLFV